MQRFKLWKLPALARTNVICQMVPADVIHLSLVSKSFRQFLMRYKLYSSQFHWVLRKTFSGGVIRIEISFFKGYYGDVTFVFGDEQGDKPKTTRFINESDFLFHREGNTFFVMNPDRNPSGLLGIEKMSKLLLDVLFVKDYNFSCETPVPSFNICDNFIWRTTQKFYSIKILDREARYTIESLKVLFGTIQTKNLKTDIKISEPDFSTHIPLRITDFMFLDNCNWLSIDNMLEAKSKTIWVKHSNSVTTDDVIKLLKTWIEGTKLKEMTKLTLCALARTENLMEEVDMLVGVSRYNDPETSDNHRQLKRVTDGKIAVLHFFHFFCDQLTIKIL